MNDKRENRETGTTLKFNTIWILCHYAQQPPYNTMLRYHNWGKQLVKRDCNVVIIAASTVHNTDIDVVHEIGKTECLCDGVQYLYIKTPKYSGNGMKRIKNMLQYCFGLSKHSKRVPRPDAIIICEAYILSGFILFGKPFITLWAGPGYSDAYIIVLLVMIPLTIPLIQNVGLSILQAQNRNLFRSVVYLAIAFVNILVSIPMAKLWGGLGCAATTGVCLIIGNIIVMNIYYHHRIGLDIVRFWKEIGRMSIPAIVVLLLGIGCSMLIPNVTVLLLAGEILIYSLIYFLAMWLFALSAYEKELLTSPVSKASIIFGIWRKRGKPTI